MRTATHSIAARGLWANRSPVTLCFILLCCINLVNGVSVSGDKSESLDKILQDGVSNKVYTGVAAIAGGKSGIEIYAKAWGNFDYLEDYPDSTAVTLDSLFDLASCSKVLSTTTAVALLYQRGYLSDLDSLASTYLGASFANGGKEEITLRHCLLHNSGLSPDPVPWYWDEEFGCPNTFDAFPREDFSCSDKIFNSIMKENVTQAPGTKYVYSDIGFQVLQLVIGTVVEENNLVDSETDMRSECLPVLMAGQEGTYSTPGAKLACYFEAFIRREVFQQSTPMSISSNKGVKEHAGPNGVSVSLLNKSSWLRSTQYLLSPSQFHAAVPTLNDTGDNSYTHTRLQGRVGDGDCFAAGGICGHAGMFSSAHDVGRILSRLLQVWIYDGDAIDIVSGGSSSSRKEEEEAEEEKEEEEGEENENERLAARKLGWLNSTTLRYFTTEYNNTQSSRALGWTINDPSIADYGYDNSCGTFSTKTFMHTGYTGTCVCVDPINEIWSVVLTNRAYNCQGQLCPVGGSDAVKAIYKNFNTEIMNTVRRNQ